MPTRPKPNADERFKRLIDEFNSVDETYKILDRERDLLVKKLRNLVKRRGRGYHNGHESSIHAHDMVRKILKAEAVKEKLSPDEFKACFKNSKYIQIDGGPLLTKSQELPDLGPPDEYKEER